MIGRKFMKVNDKLWQKTKIGGVMGMFSGRMEEFLTNGGTRESWRAGELLSLILWRWYFLQIPAIKQQTPFKHCQWRAEVEKWPKNGMFYPTVTAKMPTRIDDENRLQSSKFKIEVNVDFISFEEMPLIVDIKNKKMGKPIKYDLGEDYRNEVETGAQFLDYKNDREMVLAYLLFKLLAWRKSNEILCKVFSPEEWANLWKEIMATMENRGIEGYGTDELLEQMSKLIRKKVGVWGLNNNEVKLMEKNKFEPERERIVEWFEFWQGFCRQIAVPFSWYLPLLEMEFVDEECFKADVLASLKGGKDDIYAPATAIFITKLGKEIWR